MRNAKVEAKRYFSFLLTRDIHAKAECGWKREYRSNLSWFFLPISVFLSSCTCLFVSSPLLFSLFLFFFVLPYIFYRSFYLYLVADKILRYFFVRALNRTELYRGTKCFSANHARMRVIFVLLLVFLLSAHALLRSFRFIYVLWASASGKCVRRWWTVERDSDFHMEFGLSVWPRFCFFNATSTLLVLIDQPCINQSSLVRSLIEVSFSRTHFLIQMVGIRRGTNVLVFRQVNFTIATSISAVRNSLKWESYC